MASCDMELERQLMDAGNKLLEPPDSVDEVLHLLDQVESYLARVEQSPTKSMQSAISPSQKALVANKLFRHSEVDVKVAVASCISEITRITAPDAPYDDDQMKEVFELIVSSFEKLSDKSSRSYAKRTSILEIVAKVKSCVVMLDLECDGPVIEMFQHFLEAIRDDHPESVFSSMETIMNIVLEESEMISPDLLSPILDSVKKNEEVLPIAQKLGEKVLHSCAAKVKPNLLEAVKSSGISLDDYSEVVASICQEESVAVEQNDLSNEHTTDEEESKSVKAPFDEAARVNKEIVTEAASMEQVDLADNRSPKSIVNNGTAQTGDISKKESGASSESEAKLLKQSAKKVDTGINNGDGSSLKQSHDKKRREKATPGKDATRSSTKDDMEMVSSPKSFAKPTKDKQHFEATSKSNSKRKRTPRKGKASDTKDLGENLVGSKVKVWWPEDRMFYEGSMESFDHVKKKHKVLTCIQRVSQILRDAVNSVQQSIFNWNQTAITCIGILDDADVAGPSTAAARLSPRLFQQSTTPAPAPEANSPFEPSY